MPEPWIILRVTDNQSDIRPPECIACLRPVRKRNINRFTVEGMETKSLAVTAMNDDVYCTRNVK